MRVPELAWRAGDADEQLTAQDREWWAIHGWKSQRGVRAYQSVRAVEHVLVNMLETTVTDYTPPEGLSRMSIGDTLIGDEREGRWYRGSPPLSGSCHTGQVPRYLLLTMDQKQTQWHMAHFMARFFHVFLPWGLVPPGME